ncbi:short-chain dehydrogenase [Saccharopolyspora subtropica]|uniref:SDR family NAD(P)-dependent oxidoreductase n=1 Tax=Saccharopolyspora thermophila TaxID=89367 RepID=A0A917K2P8_9PSEU|nr:SDR family NAD(P)-dependent oxidoreductase [Saccharopolyspora subtropica]GGI98724.1 short-chain dehydrogenase [Saccharopolyspora subtropica]
MSTPVSGRRFADRVAIVTGAAGGIGSATAERLAQEGATVVLVDLSENVRHTADAIRQAGGNAEPAVVDLTDPAACSALAEDVIAQHRQIDVLVNNAGINRRGALLDLDLDAWKTSFEVNLDALFHLCRAVLPAMIERRRGAIVNTASQWGLHPAPGHIAYNVTKAGVVSFTHSLARDYAPHGIRVNAVCPGEVRTPMLEAGLARSGRTIDDLNALVPFGRIGEPSEVAALIAFLASDEAPYLCGSAVEITGAQAVS